MEIGRVGSSGTCQAGVFVGREWLFWDSGSPGSWVEGGCGNPVTRHRGRASFLLRDGPAVLGQTYALQHLPHDIVTCCVTQVTHLRVPGAGELQVNNPFLLCKNFLSGQ